MTGVRESEGPGRGRRVRELTMEEKGIPFIRFVSAAALLLLGACVVLLSWVPPVSRDALVHHLALPKLFLRHGILADFPTMVYSYYPMNLDLLYMIPLRFGNDIAPKLIHFSFGLLTAWVLYAYLKSRLGRTYGLMAALFFLSTPVIVKLSTTVYVDLGVIFFSTAALLLLLQWAERRFRSRYLLLSAVCCGLALGTKYNALICLLLLTFLASVLRVRGAPSGRRGFLSAAGSGVLYLTVALLLFSPWMIRNYTLKSNPLHPLFKGWFTGAGAGVGREGAGQIRASGPRYGFFTYRKVVYGESGWDIALLPLRIFFQGRDGDPRYFDGRLNPFLLILPVFAFLRRGEERKPMAKEKWVFLAFSVLFLCFALFTSALRIRYISPIIPPLVILSVLGVRNLAAWGKEKGASWGRVGGPALAVGLSAAMIFLNAAYVHAQFRIVEPFTYIRGSVSRDQYIDKRRPEYAAMRYMSKALPRDARVLFLFVGKRGYYCDRDYVLFEGAFKRAVTRGGSPREICRGLQLAGVSHLLVFEPLPNRWVLDNFRGDRLKRIRKFFERYVRGLYCRNGFCVAALNCPADG
ncbi:MAG: hypothetical protein DRH20_01125 [Deltaproteobacteria bacterium]|nr:MAG: hypothetical protein DRH20_01125 [Deltaproteobacteria bacterium]